MAEKDTETQLKEALEKIAKLEHQNYRLQYRINHLVKTFRDQPDAASSSAVQPATEAFASKPLAVAKDSVYAHCVPLRTVFAGKYPGMDYVGKTVSVAGWVSNFRFAKKIAFIELIDGTTFEHLQIVADTKSEGWDQVSTICRGTSLIVTGAIVKSPKPEQPIEMQAKKVHIEGACDPTKYPLTKPMHAFTFLRSIGHLRPRTTPLACVTRIRNALAFSTHSFYQEQGFLYVHSPIITASDCEGAGEMFQVSTIMGEGAKKEEGTVATLKKENYGDDFFGRPAFLTVSGQLNAEIFACSHSKVYTFGPTFRAENSNTSRHLAEFWMIEPEVAFCEMNGMMDIAEAYVRHTVQYVLRECLLDVEYLTHGAKADADGNRLFDGSASLLASLHTLVDTPFARCSYTKGIELLKAAGREFSVPIEWGMDLPTDCERYLAEEVYKGPVFVYDYPKDIKSFYMRMNDDNKTVAAFDLLVPGIGELIGGSQREEREDALLKRMTEVGLDHEAYWWYLDLRRYGTVTHAGFGLGFERLVMLCTGMHNIRDSIPFPRYPRSADF